MITFIAGTTAEYIKIAPLMRELQERGVKYQLWATDQHVEGASEVLQDFGLPPEDAHFVPSSHRQTVARTGQVIPWLARIAGTFVRFFPEFRRRCDRGIVVVHGDTFTTVIGALMGRLWGCQVAHVEAGLRSGALFNPFPEEINRRIVGRLAQLHFAPTELERDNLASSVTRGSRVIVTKANTVVDALRYAINHTTPRQDLPEHFALVTLHRFELVQNQHDYTTILRRVERLAEDMSVVMMLGQSERVLLKKYGLTSILNGNITVLEKERYINFMGILTRAALVITDSGGLQEECAILGVPTAVHRAHTERRQGLGRNVVLTEMDLTILDDFLTHWREYQFDSQVEAYHPSRIIADTLTEKA